jgi:hypothetical protein
MMVLLVPLILAILTLDATTFQIMLFVMITILAPPMLVSLEKDVSILQSIATITMHAQKTHAPMENAYIS